MTEKEMFLNSYEREFATTLTFLKAYPPDNLDFRPHPHLRSAQDLAWSFAEEERLLLGGALDGDVVYKEDLAPKTLEKIINAYQANHDTLVKRIKMLPDEAFNEAVMFGSGSEHSKEMRRGDTLWLAIMDAAHHRGQLSIYIRMAGGKVPPLYSGAGEEKKK